MATKSHIRTHDLPSKRKLLLGSAIAFVAASTLLVTTVLPAEYGIDPIGTGKALGLLAISGPVQEESIAPPEGANEFTPVHAGAVANYGAGYHFDTAEFVLEPYEYVEYKYHLETGASMVFSWKATSPVIHDFHGGADAGPKGAETSYDKRDASHANGSFIAPFAGIHGWYWENPGGERITVRVTSAGYYNAAMEFRFDGTRLRHDVTSNDVALNTK